MALTPRNRQEEWYQQMINASTGNYLPSISAQDAGKVMTVESDGSWGVENVPQELPAVETTDKDKYLHTNASTGSVEWADAPNELPAVASTDRGKFLHTNESTGALEWAAGGSGGGPLVVTDTNGTLDKTAGEIFAAVELGGACIKNVHELPGGGTGVNYNYITHYAFGMLGYRFEYYDVELVEYDASSADDYPVKFTE